MRRGNSPNSEYGSGRGVSVLLRTSSQQIYNFTGSKQGAWGGGPGERFTLRVPIWANDGFVSGQGRAGDGGH